MGKCIPVSRAFAKSTSADECQHGPADGRGKRWPCLADQQIADRNGPEQLLRAIVLSAHSQVWMLTSQADG
jgi:hypothetical protein